MEDNFQEDKVLQPQTEEVKQEEITQVAQEGKKNKTIVPLFAIILSILAIAVSLFSIFCNKQETVTASPKVIQKGDLKIAYVNTDSILAKYDMAIEMQKELQAKQKQAQQQFQSTQQKLEQDYKDYMKNGEKLTLTQQKEKEKELQTRMQQVQEMQTSLPMKLQEEQMNMNKKLLDAVYAFIADYNKKHDKYNVILSHSYANSPTLYIDKGMDITNEILDGLNEEYKNYKQD